MTGPRITKDGLANALKKIGYDPETGANQDLGEALGLLPYWGNDHLARTRSHRPIQPALREPTLVTPEELARNGIGIYSGFNRHGELDGARA